jgi:glutamate-1-semialdehyde aminotransferase
MEEAVMKHLTLVREQMQSLQGAIERMPEQIAAILLAAQETKQPVPARSSSRYIGQSADENHSFLLDDEMSTASSRSAGQDIAPEAQVQRLTAQLTAAYNRIAALEEQLLAQRLAQ